MSDREHGKEFVHPDVVGADDAAKPQLVLAAKILPDRIFILPSGPKPVLPGFMFPVILSPGTAAEVITKVVKDVPDRVLGFVMTEEEAEDDMQNLHQRHYCRIGTAVRVLKLQQAPDGRVQALLQGIQRFQIIKTAVVNKHLQAQVAYLEDSADAEDDQQKALALAIMNTMRELIKHNPVFSEEIKMFLSRADWRDAGNLADFAASMTSSSREELQDVLEAVALKPRLEKVLFLLRKELDINELKEKITHQIEEKISKQQREFFLREQLKAIKAELGLEKDDKTEEIDKYQQRLALIQPNDEARRRIEEELDKIRVLSTQSPEFSVSRTYLDWLTSLPWGQYSDDKLEIKRARRILNRDHYGLEDVKARILEFVGVAKMRGTVEGSILCLVGPPGVGKTSLGRGIAEALGRQFYRFSLGGMRDEAEIKGHRRTYIGALPGKFMQALKSVGTANPVIMLDEIDKVGASYQGDPASALLEVLDPEQNNSFRDHYLDVPFDLSKVLFIATANVPDTIPAPLLDRMEVIRLSGYIMEEKIAIAKQHLLPRLLQRNGLTRSDLYFTAAGLRAVINGHAREAGVRTLEKSLSSIMRKIAAHKAEHELDAVVKVDAAKVEELLGQAQFTDEVLLKRNRPGVVLGLAWTPVGGTTLYVEAIGVVGDYAIKQTGQLGQVMIESSQIAFSMVTANAKAFGIDPEFFRRQSIHLHVPAGATPKDGPSAGVTMATALISLALNKKLQPHLAMTGELTLTGRVLPVGGIKEKIIAAKRSKVQQVILPAQNKKDFDEIAEYVRTGISAYFVDDYREVFDLVFAAD